MKKQYGKKFTPLIEYVCSHAHFEEFVLLHVEDAVEALPAVVAAEGLFAGVLSKVVIV